MVWYAWVLVASYALNAIVTVAGIGKRRSPVTPTAAAVAVAITPLYIWAIVALAT